MSQMRGFKINVDLLWVEVPKPIAISVYAAILYFQGLNLTTDNKN